MKRRGNAPVSAMTYPDQQSLANPFWLNAVQTLTACNVLAMLVPYAVALFNPNDRLMYLGFLIFLTLFSVPFVWVFWKLSAWPDARTVKRALALATSWAFLVLIPSFMLAWDTVGDPYSGRTTANAAIISAIQAGLIFASIKTYLSMRRERSDVRILIPPLAAALLVLACLMVLVIRFGRVRY